MKLENLLCDDKVGSDTNNSTESLNSAPSIGLTTLALAASLAEHKPATPTPDKSIKPKRKRANPAQVAVLKMYYAKNPFPDSEIRLFLAQKLGMTPRSVQIWFQNQRQHEKAASTPTVNPPS